MLSSRTALMQGDRSMTDFDDVDYYLDPTLAADPHPYFHHMRDKCPVVHLPHHDVMAVTTYEATAQVLRDHENFSSCNAAGGPCPGFSQRPGPAHAVSGFLAEHRHELPMSEYAVALDEPEHHPQRGLIMRLFTPKRMKENEAFMYGLADQLIDEFLPSGKVETQSAFGPLFALLVIADLLGVPEEDRVEFRNQMTGLPTLDEAGGGESMAHDPLSYLQDKFAGYIEDRRREPRADVLTSLAQITFPDGTTPDIDAICRMATFTFAAGQDTTARLITASLRHIAEDPKLQAYLREDPQRI